jgi:hypothetical protein
MEGLVFQLKSPHDFGANSLSLELRQNNEVRIIDH